MAETEYIPAGSALHQAFHAFSQEALRITAELNGAYHTPEEVRALMSQLTASEIDESFAMFPPFHTDCGKNTKIGKRVFINAGCQFQDQGGITIGDDVRIGAGSVVVKEVPPNCTVVGVPGRIVSRNGVRVDMKDVLEHNHLPDVVEDRMDRMEGEIEQLRTLTESLKKNKEA